ncbi:SDR family oxidoreductase [Aestuariicella hydrocarbonica]|uniref:SDR family oxidoreductase n=1 Tax=Pseudomaricurvus hydrocarbonicus TaxID=1470433 RepID=A0A9E5JWP1_9GAMM|nr:SDR family oxidoreductase [Aestuariicella hydrocarbonica]NHO65951.1 SDR family oxidoreductase [Aestuariicella hydrocarbonica]
MSKVIVITGAGVGLGRALARRFASKGDQIVLLGRTLSKVEAAAAEIGAAAMAVRCDVGNPDSVREAFAAIAERHAKIDILINNAAIFEPFLLQNATDAQIFNAITTNLAGPMFTIRAAIPAMGDGSHIFNITSESVGMDFPHLSVYQASKAGVERLSKSMDTELEAQGIRVTNVRAGQMYEEGKVWEANPEDQMAFAKAAMERGLNLRERPTSQFDSVVDAFCALVDLPADLHADAISLHGRKPQ